MLTRVANGSQAQSSLTHKFCTPPVLVIIVHPEYHPEKSNTIMVTVHPHRAGLDAIHAYHACSRKWLKIAKFVHLDIRVAIGIIEPSVQGCKISSWLGICNSLEPRATVAHNGCLGKRYA